MTSPQETVTRPPKEGDPAPKFKLPAHPSGTVSLEDFKGKKNVILAFYPKDDTPGCTKEMCSFSDDLDKFNTADTQVLGISCDTVQSHQAFAQKFSLKQPLLADEGGKVGQLYGTVREGQRNANRVLFLIDKQGIIRHIYEGMPTNADLLGFVQNMK